MARRPHAISITSNLIKQRQLTRRGVLQGAAALGGGALFSSVATPSHGLAANRSLATQATPADFTREASIVSWGFGVEETNPLAFARVDAFRAAYPTINLEVIPEFDDQKLLTAAASGELPDLLWVDRFKVASYAARGVLSPLDDLVSEADFDMSRFYEAAVNEATYEDQLYGIPQFMDVRPLYVNLDALGEAGVTQEQLNTGDWDQLAEIGTQLTKRSGDRVDRWGFDPKAYDFFWMWGAGNGGTFISDDAQEVSFNDPKLVEALDWAVKTYDAQGGFSSFDAFRTTFQGNEEFARGQVAMIAYENWMLGIVARVAPTLNFAVLPVKERNGDGLLSFTGGNSWSIPTDASDPEAAWEFIKFMNAEETWLIGANAVKEARVSQGQPYIPSLTANRVADQLQIDQVYEAISPQFDAAVQLFPQLIEESPNRPVANSPVGGQLQDILTQDGVLPALRGELSAEDALTQANDAAQDAIDSF